MSGICRVGGFDIGGDAPTMIAGPCVIEDGEEAGDGLRFCVGIASRLSEVAKRNGANFVFKASYDKANRSSIRSYRGPGLQRGLEILATVREEVGCSVTTDVHLPGDVEAVAAAVDMIQIPAFLCRQTDLLAEAGRSGKPVNIKKGQFMAPFDMANVVEKVASSGCSDICLTERGSCFGYNNLVVDMRSIMTMVLQTGRPVIFDATHSCQLPGGGVESGGDGMFAWALSRAAVATGYCSGVFLETHPDPSRSLSDGRVVMRLDLVDDFWRGSVAAPWGVTRGTARTRI